MNAMRTFFKSTFPDRGECLSFLGVCLMLGGAWLGAWGILS